MYAMVGTEFCNGYGYAGRGGYVGEGYSVAQVIDPVLGGLPIKITMIDLGGLVVDGDIDYAGDPTGSMADITVSWTLATPFLFVLATLDGEDIVVLRKQKYGERRTMHRQEVAYNRWIATQSQWPTHYTLDVTFGPIDKTSMELFTKFLIKHDAEVVTLTDGYGYRLAGMLLGDSAETTRVDWRPDLHLFPETDRFKIMGKSYADQAALTLEQGHFEIAFKILVTQSRQLELTPDVPREFHVF